ncbi:MAG: hypothetical protein IKY19_02300, partial [Bacteroidaceae bacterium]|nr:hypothetical protein [Bacteroidaceae bacterium]
LILIPIPILQLQCKTADDRSAHHSSITILHHRDCCHLCFPCRKRIYLQHHHLTKVCRDLDIK